MEKEPEVDRNEIYDALKKEPVIEEGDFTERGAEEPRFFQRRKKTLLIGGAAVLLVIAIIAVLVPGGSGLSRTDYRNLMARLERLEARLASLEGKTEYHVVERGDSLSLIARKYGLTVEELSRLNKIKPNQPIRPGQKLLVSGAKGP